MAAFFPYRLARWPFFLRFLAYFAVQLAILCFMGWAVDSAPPNSAAGAGALLVGGIVSLSTVTIFLAAAMVPRARDMGLSRWVLLVLLVPPLGTVLLLGLLAGPTDWYLQYRARRIT